MDFYTMITRSSLVYFEANNILTSKIFIYFIGFQFTLYIACHAADTGLKEGSCYRV